jgi:hypothetical protein
MVKASILWLFLPWKYRLGITLSTRLIVHTFTAISTIDLKSSSIERPETLCLLNEISQHTIDHLLRIAISIG